MRNAASAAMLWLLLAASVLAPRSALAAGHSENWCADAVDFAMRTAQYRDFGRSHEYTSHSIQHDAKVFLQEYPYLSTPDMQNIADTVYNRNWSHFGAASEMSKSCKARHEAPPPALLTLDHSDEWCANAVDFAMGVAQNRELDYSQKMIASSFDQNPIYYHMQFPELNKDEMLGITDAVYQRRWTRFGAAASVTRSCKATLQAPPPKAAQPQT